MKRAIYVALFVLLTVGVSSVIAGDITNQGGGAAPGAAMRVPHGGPGPHLSQFTKIDKSPPLREMVPPPRATEKRKKHLLEPTGTNVLPPDWQGEWAEYAAQPVLQSWFTPEGEQTRATPTPTLNVEGLGAGFPGYTYSWHPPDTQGAIGDSYYLQWINLDYTVFNRDGSVVDLNAAGSGDDFEPGNSLWTGFGGDCEEWNDGDPITVWDHLAHRWVMAQFTVTVPAYYCIAVSETADPTGSWYRFSMEWPYVLFPDYPKIALWPDAYYVSARDFDLVDGGFFGAHVVALPRPWMLVGSGGPGVVDFGPLYDATPTQVWYDNLLPADLEGDPPPAGTPCPFLASDDTNMNRLLMWDFHVDWATPADSTFGIVDGDGWINPNRAFTVPAWTLRTQLFGTVNYPIVDQQGTTRRIDSFAGQLMHRLQYRYFGYRATPYQSLVTNMGVEGASTNTAPRWFELKYEYDGSPAWVVAQDGTYDPDIMERWMGSIAQDYAGNMALGYSLANNKTDVAYPSIRYTSRLVTDGVGTMPQGEVSIMAGTSYSDQGTTDPPYDRWGDYSSMRVDPVDDTTFWYTQMYIGSTTLPYNWHTRLASFAFPCNDGGLNDPPATASNVQALADGEMQITVSWTAVSGATGYRVFRSTTQGGPYAPLGSTASTSYTDTNVMLGVTYYYRVRTYEDNNCWSASDSIEVQGTPWGECTDEPYFSGIGLIEPLPDVCGLVIQWPWALGWCTEPVVYNIYRSTTPGFTPDPATNMIASCVANNSYVDTGLTAGQKYYYIVRAEDATIGHGGPCNDGNEDTNSWWDFNIPPNGVVQIYNETFQTWTPGSFANWRHSTFGLGSDAWRGVQECPAASGKNIFRFGHATDCAGTYPLDANSIAYPQPDYYGIMVPNGVQSLSLSWAHRWEFTPPDGAQLYFSWLSKDWTSGVYPYFDWADVDPASANSILLSGEGYNQVVRGEHAGYYDGWGGSSTGYPVNVSTSVDVSEFCNYWNTLDGSWPANCSDILLFATFAGYRGPMYNRMDANNGWIASCQDFETVNNIYDAEGADDFDVPAAGWTIDRVEVWGGYWSGTGPADSVDIIFTQEDNSGAFPVPGTGIPACGYCDGSVAGYTCDQTPITGTAMVDDAGSFALDLVPDCVLPQGRYWMITQVNMPYTGHGQWGWLKRDDQMYGENVWRNPGNGFGVTICIPWGRHETDCGTTGKDFAYGLYGPAPDGEGWFLDNVVLSYNSGPACTSSDDPKPVRFFTATSTGGSTAGSGVNKLEWSNPISTNIDSFVLLYRTDGYWPDGPTDAAATVVSCSGLSTASGAYNSCTNSGLNPDTYYAYAIYVGYGGDYSGPRRVLARPDDTTGALEWIYQTGATNLAPPGLGSVYGVSNDRNLHSMNPTSGDWPSGWTPASMNGPAQGRPPVVNYGASKVAYLTAQDGYAYAVNAATGGNVWAPVQPGGAGSMLQAAAALELQYFGGAYNLILVGTRNATMPNQFYGLNTSSGSTAWTYDGAGDLTSIGIINGAAVVDYANHRAYFASRERGGGYTDTLFCIQYDDSSASQCAGAWPLALGSIDGSPMPESDWSRIYVGNNAGQVYAVDTVSSPGAILWGPISLADGPVKGYIWPDGAGSVYLSTTNRVWSLNATNGAVQWSATHILGPSIPLLAGANLVVGSTDGYLHQIAKASGAATATPFLLGDGTSVIGSPALDVVNNLMYAGSESGAVYAVTAPLP